MTCETGTSTIILGIFLDGIKQRSHLLIGSASDGTIHTSYSTYYVYMIEVYVYGTEPVDERTQPLVTGHSRQNENRHDYRCHVARVRESLQNPKTTTSSSALVVKRKEFR